MRIWGLHVQDIRAMRFGGMVLKGDQHDSKCLQTIFTKSSPPCGCPHSSTPSRQPRRPDGLSALRRAVTGGHDLDLLEVDGACASGSCEWLRPLFGERNLC